MTITLKIDQKNNLTIFSSKENLKVDDFLAAIKRFYQGEPTKNVIWDVNKAAVWDLCGNDLEKMAYFAPRFESRGEGAKTAIVARDDFSESLSKLFALFGKSKKLPIQVQTFKTIKDAMAWIIS